MLRLVVLVLALPWAAACAYHFPFHAEGDRTPLGRPHDEVRRPRPLAQIVLGFVGSTALTLAIHEGAHALAAKLAGGDDVRVAFFTDGHLGLTTYHGKLSTSERNLVDLAGPLASWMVGEGCEWLLARDKVPVSWRPWIAQWALTSKADAALAALNGLVSDEADLGAVADRSGFSPVWWLVPVALDGVAHHRLALDLWREATTLPAMPSDGASHPPAEEGRDPSD